MRRREFMAGLLISGCAPSLANFPFDRGMTLTDSGLRIKYYSVGCFLIEFEGVTFLSDPFWSHLSFNQITFGKTLAEPALVDPYLPELIGKL
jgi:hypothetical protein